MTSAEPGPEPGPEPGQVPGQVASEVLYEVDGPTATITLNRPESLNGWTASMDAAVAASIERATADPAVVGIVITGAGRAFCAGADMKMLDAITTGGEQAMADQPMPWTNSTTDFDGRFTYLMEVPKPVIAAVNGAVAGMAFPLTLCCDLRVVTPEALFLTAFPQRGLIAEWGLSWLLPRQVGPGVALDLLFSGRRMYGEEAVRVGLANYLVPGDELLGFCKRYVEQLAASSSPTSIAHIKRQVYRQLHGAGADGLGAAERESQRLMVDSFGRPDFAEGVASFLERRPPSFGRITGPPS